MTIQSLVIQYFTYCVGGNINELKENYPKQSSLRQVPFFFSQSQPWKNRRHWWVWFFCFLFWVWVLGLVKSMEELFVMFVGILLLDLKTMCLKVFLSLSISSLGVFFQFLSFWSSFRNGVFRFWLKWFAFCCCK